MSYETMTYKKCTICLEQDDDPRNPRTDCDNFGTMLCKYRGYDLGDEENPDVDDILTITKRKDVIWMPLYLYDHSGITMRAGTARMGDEDEAWMSPKGRFVGDGAGWDTSTVGIIYCTKDKAVAECGKKKFTKKVYEQAVKIMEGEVETYALYLEGNVYGCIVEGPHGEEIDSCWGFIEGYKNAWKTKDWYCVKEAKGTIDRWRARRAKELKAERKQVWETRNVLALNKENALALKG